MSIKLCVVTTTSQTISAFVLPSVNRLTEEGFEVSFATSPLKGFMETLPEGVKVFDIPVGRGFDFIGTFKAAKKFEKICKKEKFDIVMYSTPNGALYGSIGSKRAKVRARILGQWGMRLVGFEGIMRKFILELEKISCRNATHVRAVSEKNRLIAIENKMYKPEKCKVLGKGGTIGVDLSLFDLSKKAEMRSETREKYSIPENAFVFGFVGSVRADKGVKELLTAFRSLNDDSYLVLCGGVFEDDGIDPELMNWAKANKNVVFTGHINDVYNHMAAFDVLVHPTYREGFGMVLQEAAALSIPTITTNIPGASEAIVDGVTGLLSEVKNADSLSEVMKKLKNSPEICLEYGENGRKRIEEDFERTKMVERLVADYKEIYEETRKQK